MATPKITTALDNDAYKFYLSQLAFYIYPNAIARYEFIDRGHTPLPNDFFAHLIRAVEEFNHRRFSDDDVEYLRSSGLFKESYLDWLRHRHRPYDATQIKISNGKITAEGPWWVSTLLEIPLLYTYSDIYYHLTEKSNYYFVDYERRVKELDSIGVKWLDFGTRRRRSARTQEFVGVALEDANHCLGTSNVMLAAKHRLPCVGTYPHEGPMAMQALTDLRNSNYYFRSAWQTIYGKSLNIALTDTLTTDNFLAHACNLWYTYDGWRQDSGCPKSFVDKLLRKCEERGVVTKTKTITFSDGLNPTKIRDIENYVDGRFQTKYGVGTWLTCDVPQPLNIVCKLTHIDDKAVCKLSDEPGKATGDPEAIQKAREFIAESR